MRFSRGVAFAERNQVKVGAVGLVIVLIGVLLSLNLDGIARFFQARYYVEFSHAAALKAGDEVRMSGVEVGRVEQVQVVDDHVRVRFSVSQKLGDASHAAIKTESVLGNKFLALNSVGKGTLARGATIPASRTSLPYDIIDATADLTRTAGAIDVEQLARSFDTMAALLEETPDVFGDSLQGVSRLSATIAQRDQELHRVLEAAGSISDVLATRNQDIVGMLTHGTSLMQMIETRRDTIASLLRTIVAVTKQLDGFVDEHDATLQEVASELTRTAKVLRKHKDGLAETIGHYAGYARALSEALAAGPYFYGYTENTSIVNLLPILPILLDRQAAQAGP